ncbi:GNAT family N-acetyltransferase [Microcoleus sp. FACHB-672]|uniref:GNAT family N-acetyltransferase n=1 Tax=Microcoleus sp. FACHB-672 TaxID=2692825 RepID=UPI001681F3FA|nr:GNAT family N-acetyltransferase [Microcoleus sp. FACHB-672]MBD2040954.1 GNAT family N-acetyltransferase [Microcoleus sp. FACHB-672]
MQIIDLSPDDDKIIQQLAGWLVEQWPNSWPDIKSGLQEVRESLGEDRISRVAVDETGSVLGWIGGISQYNGNVWELHPLIVSKTCRGRGIGSALIADLETLVRERAGLTIWVGTDDEENQTTLSGVDLYSNPWEKITNIKNLVGHPYEFYQKCGFTIVGVMPDANGLGKPDIYMAKPVKQK